ncbi:hypothetical protein GGI12_004306 [Dipsacomyces acuminosporus]|nr:hypothetical protein GGI12_004306 [Dipsacomyces acuminosporus]
MGKSAKAFKRPTKKQKEIKKAATDKADQPSLPSSSVEQHAASTLTKPSGGISKSKTTKLKAKIAAAAAAAAVANKTAGTKSSKKKRKDYMALYARK